MGTRADFYLAKENSQLQWVGSIAWDGYEPDGVEVATTPQGFLNIVLETIAKRDDYTSPEDGWPWPWDDSALTDCVYVFDENTLWHVVEDGNFIKWSDREKAFDEEGEFKSVDNIPTKRFDYPNMKDIKNVAWGKNSGIIVVGLK